MKNAKRNLRNTEQTPDTPRAEGKEEHFVPVLKLFQRERAVIGPGNASVMSKNYDYDVNNRLPPTLSHVSEQQDFDSN